MSTAHPIPALAGPIQFAPEFACDTPRVAALMLTRRCNMTCGHCSVASGPGIRQEPDEATILRRVDELIAAGIRAVLLTGGEPMLPESLVLEAVERFSRADISVSMTSNGFWGAEPEAAARIVRALRRAGLCLLTVSYDRFHAEFMAFGPVRNISLACAAEGLPMNLNITRTAHDAELEEFAVAARDLPGVRMRFYDVQPVGRARHLDGAQLRANIGGFCNAAGIPVVTDDGRVLACNGPSYFQPVSSPLHCGSSGEPLARGLQRHGADPLLEGIRVLGPSRLLKELSALPAFAGFEARDRYGGMCDLCLHLTGTPGVADALRAHLSTPALQAEMHATRRVVQGSDRDLRRVPRLNAVVAPRALLQAVFDPAHRLSASADQIFGRADLDWNRLLRYLTACGLARPLLPLLDDPVIRHWAPGFFVGALRRAGEAAATKTLLARNVLRKVAGVLDSVGARAVLLKTPALALFADANDHVPAPGDLDLLVLDGRAAEIRERLLESGFHASPRDRAGRRPIEHHLPTILASGIAVEIHHRIGPPSAFLPETELLCGLEPLHGPVFRMRPEALLLHIVSHSVRHHFRLGLKTAWSAWRILTRSPDFDPFRLLELLRAYPCARAFWGPLLVFHRELGLPVPEALLAAAPADRIQKRIDRIVRAHVFTSLGLPGEKQPFLAPTLDLLIHTRIESALADLPRILAGAFIEAVNRSRNALRELPDAESPASWVRANFRALRGSYRLLIAG